MIKSEKKTPVPVKVYPKDPENINLTKAQFIEKRNKIRERDALINAFAAKVDSGEIEIPGLKKAEVAPVVAPVKETTPVENTLQKPRGRPKKS